MEFLKIVQENLIRIFCNSKNRKYFSLRLGYVFGKRMKNFRIIKKIFLINKVIEIQ